MSERREQLDFAIDTAVQAGRITLGYFQRGTGVEEKEDLSPVTVADREAEEYVRSRINDAYPRFGILGEEFGEEDAGASRRWIVDPIDGTKSFIRGVPLYGVLLALEVEGNIEVGVAHFPALGETVWAARGEGCYLNGQRCWTRSTSDLAQAFVSFTDAASFERYGRSQAWRNIVAASSYRPGWSDAYGHALVATGRLEVMLDPAMNPWDCGPFPVLLREAGGYFGDWSGRETIYGNEAVSVCGSLKDEVLAAIDVRDKTS